MHRKGAIARITLVDLSNFLGVFFVRTITNSDDEMAKCTAHRPYIVCLKPRPPTLDIGPQTTRLAVCPLDPPSSLLEAEAGSPKTLRHQPAGDHFRSWLALFPRDWGVCHRRLGLRVHRSFTVLQGLQLNCATLKWLP